MEITLKGATSKFPLRMTPQERALVEEVQEVYGAAGVAMSLNDVLRHLVRRAAIVLAHTVEESSAAIRAHCGGCPDCDADALRFGCPDGLYLYRSYRRVCRAHGGSQSADSL